MPRKGLYRPPFSSAPSIRRCPAPFHRRPGKNMWWCVDFAMPHGTPVLAARDGIVVQRESRYARNYRTAQYASRANSLSIRHADGQESYYVHLAWRSIRTRIGQRVRAGEVIGLSGATGYATYPHLHFGVFDATGRNIPIPWR